MKFAFTIDADWTLGSHVGLIRLYEFCERRRLPVTVFFAGRFAEAYPELALEAARRGYVIGAHGWEHGRDPKEDFREAPLPRQDEWLKRATAAIEDACGVGPIAFRAPNLSICEGTFGLLYKHGYTLDSSVPAKRLTGWAQLRRSSYFRAPLRPYHPSAYDLSLEGDCPILEVPPSAWLLPINMSALRTFGTIPMHCAARLVSRASNLLVFYAHPTEFEYAENQEINLSDPKRYRKGLGPQNIGSLERFVEGILGMGYIPVSLSEFNSTAPEPCQATNPPATPHQSAAKS